MIEQRLYPDPVSAQKQPARRLLIHCKGEDTVELFDALFLVTAVRLQEHLGVTASAEAESYGFQLIPELSRIVQLAVVDDGVFHALIQGAHRLLTRFGVDDRQPPVEQRRVTADVLAVFVGTATAQTQRHPLGQLTLLVYLSFAVKPACYTAHIYLRFVMAIPRITRCCLMFLTLPRKHRQHSINAAEPAIVA